MLRVAADGFKFTPYIIYKGMSTPGGTIGRQLRRVEAAANEEDGSFEGFPTSLFYAVQHKGWMTSELMVEWLTKVYRPWCLTKTGPTMLILDEFAGHMTSVVRDAVVDCGGFVEFIPGGYTWKLQVMDVGVNKPFKDRIRDKYDQWFFNQGCTNKPQREDVAKWVKASFEGVSTTTIIKTWKRVGLIYDDENVLDVVQHNNNNDENNVDDDDDTELDDADNVDEFDQLGIDELTLEEREFEDYYNDVRNEFVHHDE
jgi:DDE superfamily endonuclease